MISDDLSGTVFLVVLDKLFTEVNSIFVQVPPLRDLNDLHPIEEATPPVVERAKVKVKPAVTRVILLPSYQGDFDLLKNRSGKNTLNFIHKTFST